MRRVDSLEKTLMLGGIGGRRRRGRQRIRWLDASLTRWTWVWVNSGSWWWTGRPGVLRFMGSQRVGHDWATDLIWSDCDRSQESNHHQYLMGPDAMILAFWMLGFKPTFLFSSFTFIKSLFHSSSFSAIRVGSSVYLMLLIFSPAILIPACGSPSPALCMMYSA